MMQSEFTEQSIVIGCNYHIKWQSHKAMRFVLARAKNYVQENSQKYGPSHSLVIGELKHRAVALKHRLTAIQKLNTYDLTRKGI